MNETEPLPTPPAENESTTENHATTPRRGVRPVIIGVAAGLAVVALGIGGAVIADSLDGSDDAIVVASRDDSSSATPSPVPMTSDVPTPTASPMPISDDTPISGSDYDAVAAAAIAAAGGSGTIEELKREDDGSVAWEVDVRLPNGAKVEVELAADLAVLSTRIDD